MYNFTIKANKGRNVMTEVVAKSKTQEKGVLLKQLEKFASVGVINTIVDLGILNFLVLYAGFTSVLTILGFDLVIAGIISTLIAILNSYVLNKYWTFRDKSKENLIGQFGLFVLLSLGGAAINNIIFSLLYVNWTLPGEFAYSIASLVGIDNIFGEEFIVLNFAKAVGIAVALAWNFIAYKKFVFRT